MKELELIKNFPNVEPREWSYLERIGVSQRETVIANILGYYFDPNEAHGLGDLFIQALLQTEVMSLSTKKNTHKPVCAIEHSVFEWAKIHIEKSTTKNKRIDIVIETENFIIAIEFKINHSLDNPLDDYVERIKEFKKKHNYFIVLTPFWKMPSKSIRNNKEFSQVILSKFIKNIIKLKENKTPLIEQNIEQEIYYNDFIKTITNRSKMVNMINEYFEFSKKGNNGVLIENVFQNLNIIKVEIENKANAFLKKINKTYENHFSILKKSQKSLESVIITKLSNNDELKIRFAPQGSRVELWSKKRGKIENVNKPVFEDLSFKDIENKIEVIISKNG